MKLKFTTPAESNDPTMPAGYRFALHAALTPLELDCLNRFTVTGMVDVTIGAPIQNESYYGLEPCVCDTCRATRGRLFRARVSP